MNFDKEPIKLTPEQISAIAMVKANSVSILTGGPGTGKTSVCKEIIKDFLAKGMSIALCAPSGKAAKKLQESTGYPASTIHRLLEPRVFDGTFTFTRCQDLPLEAEFIIVDETSMVDTSLMASLLSAIRTHAKILFVGDQAQLPSVGPGAVFRDFIASHTIPTTTLTIIHRHSGAIVEACHEIRNGRSYTPPNELDVENGNNLRHIEENDPARIVGIIRAVIDRMIDRGYDPLWDIQVLSPLNKRTIMSCDSINEVMQEALNPNPQIENYRFRVGDKVINTRNERAQLITRNGFETETFIVNGDLGIITAIEKQTIQVKFLYPDRHVYLSRVENNLLMAYCCTVHRYQGSEVPVVILPMHSSFGFFVNRPLVYTAISRAQDICITVGQFAAIEAAIKRIEVSMRNTMLKPQLMK